MLLDIHTHREAPYPEGIVSLRLPELPLLVPGQLYSVGIHPWDTDSEFPEDVMFAKLEEMVAWPQVAAVGECGVDPLKGAPMFKQLQIFKAQVDIAEKVGKPVIIHSVKSADVILGLKRDLNSTVPWIVHGFRGKAPLALQLVNKGIYLSFGEKFNEEAVKVVPSEYLLAETDESAKPIEEIIAQLEKVRCEKLIDTIERNISTLIGNRGMNNAHV